MRIFSWNAQKKKITSSHLNKPWGTINPRHMMAQKLHEEWGADVVLMQEPSDEVGRALEKKHGWKTQKIAKDSTQGKIVLATRKGISITSTAEKEVETKVGYDRPLVIVSVTEDKTRVISIGTFHAPFGDDSAVRTGWVSDVMGTVNKLDPGEKPCIIMGDFNTKAVPRNAGAGGWRDVLGEKAATSKSGDMPYDKILVRNLDDAKGGRVVPKKYKVPPGKDDIAFGDDITADEFMGFFSDHLPVFIDTTGEQKAVPAAQAKLSESQAFRNVGLPDKRRQSVKRRADDKGKAPAKRHDAKDDGDKKPMDTGE